MDDKVFNVLFLCTGNSARSIMGESLLNHYGAGRFRAFSAGSHPKASPHPMALELLRSLDLPTEGLYSKSWEVYGDANAPKMDFVFTVCDSAASEVCPIWPGQPMTAHWGVFDPAAAEGPEIERREAFRRAFRELENRIRIFTSLRPEKLDRIALKRKLAEIGRTSVVQPSPESV
jgi:arsenate reductase